MCVATRIVEWLRSMGHNVVHLREENLQRISDKEVFKKAVSENRILLTFDLDFGKRMVCCSRCGYYYSINF